MLIIGIGVLVLTAPISNPRWSHKIYMKFKGLVLWVIGIKVHGEPFERIGPGLIIANHRSYLDVLFIPTEEYFTIVGKVEDRAENRLSDAAVQLPPDLIGWSTG